MKIAMIGHKQFPSRSGGIEVVVYELATRLIKLGETVFVYDRYELDKKRKYPKGSYKGVQIKLCPTVSNSKVNALLASITGSIRVLFSKPDVIHYHAIGPCAMIWLPHLFGIHTVATIHGLDWQRCKWGQFASTYLKFGERMAVKYADEIIVLSEDMQKYFMDTYGRETNLIKNGISKMETVSPNLIHKYGLETDNYILYLGRIVPEKKVDKLIEAYNHLDTNKKLVIAGDLDNSEYCNKIRKMVNDNENIIFTGFVKGRLLKELYSNAYLFVLPSDLEGCSIALLEALSYGIRVLVSDIEENREVVGEYATTFEVNNEEDFENKLKNILESDSPHYNEKQVEYVLKKYNWDDVVEKTMELYKSKKLNNQFICFM